MLIAQNLMLARRGKRILDQVCTDFRTGQLSVVLGPNGAGKSSLFKLLTAAWEPDAGQVTLDGTDVRRLDDAAIARRRAVLAQETSLTFDFTVEEVVMLGRIPHLKGWETARDRQAAAQALEAVEMQDFRRRGYLSLSGGEKQRVQLARVLAQIDDAPEADCGSRWLFLDEPTSALDLRHQHATLALVQRLSRERGMGVCAVLHDLNLALRYADKVVLLSRGQVAAQGTPVETLTAERVSQIYAVEAEVLTSSHQAQPLIHIRQHAAVPS